MDSGTFSHISGHCSLDTKSATPQTVTTKIDVRCSYEFPGGHNDPHEEPQNKTLVWTYFPHVTREKSILATASFFDVCMLQITYFPAKFCFSLGHYQCLAQSRYSTFSTGTDVHVSFILRLLHENFASHFQSNWSHDLFWPMKGEASGSRKKP